MIPDSDPSGGGEGKARDPDCDDAGDDPGHPTQSADHREERAATDDADTHGDGADADEDRETAGASAPDSDPDPGGLAALGALSEQVRSTAKWLIAAFAAVGVLLVPGLQLANLGALTGSRLAWALVSAAVALAAVIMAAATIARLSSMKAPSFADLVRRERRNDQHDPLIKVLDSNRTLLQAEAGTLAELRDRYRAALAAREEAYGVLNPARLMQVPGNVLSGTPTPEETEQAQAQLDTAKARAALLRPILEQIASVVEFQDISRKFRRQRWYVAGLTVLAAAALVSFAVAVHSPDHATSDFSHAHLTNLDFDGSNLREADFNGAVLTGVDLHGADLQDANFSGAILTMVNLRNARTEGIDSDGTVLVRSICVDGTLDGGATAQRRPPATSKSDTSTKRTSSTSGCIVPRPIKPPIGQVPTKATRGTA